MRRTNRGCRRPFLPTCSWLRSAPCKGIRLAPARPRARAQYRERRIASWIGSRSLSALGVSFALEAIHRTMLRFVLFVGAHALHREERILRPAVALFANPHLLAPQVGLNRVPLRHLVVLEALRKTQARAIAELANQREHLPFHVRGRPFARIVEENLVLDLQPAQLLIEQTQFFISGHKDSPLPTLASQVWGWRGPRCSGRQTPPSRSRRRGRRESPPSARSAP